MKILILYDGTGPKYHRLFLPCFHMPGVELIIRQHLHEQDLEGVDIVFFNRIISSATIIPAQLPGKPTQRDTLISSIVKAREVYGFKLVADFDDYWHLGKDHLLHDSYKEHDVSQGMEEFIKISDAVFVTHERLYDLVSPLNKNCHILPNAIPKSGQFLVDKVPCEQTRLFWAGGITHKKDMELLRRPLQLIKRDRCKFVLGGYVRDNPEWFTMAKIFTTDSSYNTEVLESLPVEKYYAMYAHCDIALVPLIYTAFNRNKSNLKILEAANVSAPVIVSRVHPYLGFPEDIVNYVDMHRPWVWHISRLLGSPAMVEDQGERLKEYCDRVFNFTAINIERKQIFSDLCYSKASTPLTPSDTYIPPAAERQPM